jgi:hypothetical protein
MIKIENNMYIKKIGREWIVLFAQPSDNNSIVESIFQEIFNKLEAMDDHDMENLIEALIEKNILSDSFHEDSFENLECVVDNIIFANKSILESIWIGTLLGEVCFRKRNTSPYPN